MSLPQFTAENSLFASSLFNPSPSTGPADQAVLQACPPLGTCNKASRYCQSPDGGGMWCAILGRCFDCGAWD